MKNSVFGKPAFIYFKKEEFVIKKVFFKSNIDLCIDLFGFVSKKIGTQPLFLGHYWTKYSRYLHGR